MSQKALISGERTVSSQKRLARTLLYAVLILWAVFMIMPFAWMIITSLKTRLEAMKIPLVWIPAEPQWENYTKVLTQYNFGLYYKNTAIVTIVTVGVQIITCSMAAYVFARLNFPGKNFIFVLMLSVMMVPTQMIMIPRYVITIKMGLLNTLWGIIVSNIPSIYGTFFLRQNFQSLPRDLDESAMLDGCGFFRIYWSILLPLVTNGLISYAVLGIMWAWNDFLWPLLVISSSKNYVLSIAISNMQGEYNTDFPLMMTAGTVSMIPILIVFVFAQKYLMEGIAISGLKN
ncbi:MAG: carbohydrate ABC transporter permease [Christensenellales bacterium]|jgi:multiple sugar transport system permease protein